MADGRAATNRTRAEWVTLTIGTFAGTLLVTFIVGLGALALTNGLGSLGLGAPIPSLSGIGVFAFALASVLAVVAGVVLRPRDLSGARGARPGRTEGLDGPRWWTESDAAHRAARGADSGAGPDEGLTP